MQKVFFLQNTAKLRVSQIEPLILNMTVLSVTKPLVTQRVDRRCSLMHFVIVSQKCVVTPEGRSAASFAEARLSLSGSPPARLDLPPGF